VVRRQRDRGATGMAGDPPAGTVRTERTRRER
jgi:hypothetical protein